VERCGRSCDACLDCSRATAGAGAACQRNYEACVRTAERAGAAYRKDKDKAKYQKNMGNR
jgi:hypothetical protein